MTARRHWFRVADELLWSGMSNDELATLVRIGCRLNIAWARSGLGPEEACHARLTNGEILQITGRGRRDVALKLLGRLADLTSLSVEDRGDVVAIFWPKWAEFQGLRDRAGPEAGPRSSPPHPHPHPHPQKREDTRPSGGAPAAPPPQESAAPEGDQSRSGQEEAAELPLAGADPPAPRTSRWTAALGHLEGEEREKAAWVHEHLPGVEAAAEAEALAEHLKVEPGAEQAPKPLVRARTKHILIARYTSYLKRGEREYRDAETPEERAALNRLHRQIARERARDGGHRQAPADVRARFAKAIGLDPGERDAARTSAVLERDRQEHYRTLRSEGVPEEEARRRARLRVAEARS